MLRKLFKILRRLFWVLLILLVAAYIALQHPATQTWLTQKAARWLSDELGTNVRVGGVDIDLFARAVLEDVYIEDKHQDTLAIIGAIHIGSHAFDKAAKRINIGDIQLDDPLIHLARYEGERGLNFQFLIDYFGKKDSTSTDSSRYEVNIASLEVNRGEFRFFNFKRPERTRSGIDWNRLQVNDVNLRVNDMHAIGDSLFADIQMLTASEKSGFQLTSLKGSLVAGPGKIDLKQTSIQTPCSDIRGDLSFAFKSMDDWDDFEQKVKMDNKFAETTLCLNDLAFFAPEFKGLNNKITLSGDVKGKVSNLKGRNLEVRWDTHSYFKGDIAMEGLPDINNTFIELDVDQLTSNKAEIDRIPLPPFDSIPVRTVRSPENFARLGQMTFTGNFTGFINDFVAYGRLHTAIGDVRSDIALREDTASGEYVYTGNLAPEHFDFGAFYGKNDFGFLTAALKVEGSGLKVSTIDADLEGVITEFEYKGYTYRDAAVRGNYKSRAFDGDLVINDENAALDFHGKVNFTGKEPFFSFQADIYNLNLKELNLYPSADYSGISGFVQLDSCIGLTLDSFRGNVLLSNINYCSQGIDYHIAEARLSSVFEGPYRTIEIQSPFATGNLNGIFDFKGIEKSVGDVIAEIITTYQPPQHVHRPQNFTLDLREINVDEITRLFFPDWHIAPHSRLFVRLNEPQDIFEINAHTDSLISGQHRIYDLTFDVSRPDRSLYLTATADHAVINGFELASVAIDSYTDQNQIQTNVVWGDSTTWHGGEISGKFNIRGNENFDFLFGSSNIRLNDKVWNFQKDAFVQVDSSYIRINEFALSHGGQRIAIDGIIAETSRPKLNIDINAFQLADLNFLTQKNKVRMQGVLSGSASVRDFYDDRIFTSDLVLNDFVLNDREIGDLCLESEWDNTLQVLEIMGELERDKLTPLTFDGFYRPADEKSPLDLMAHARDFDLSFINGFLSPGMIDLSGKVTGDISITGTTAAPQLDGDVLPRDVSLYVYYLNTRYFVKQEVGIRPDMITFDAIEVTDQEGHPGVLTGAIIHDNFHAWNFDITIDMEEEKFLCMDTEMTENSLYYGKAYGLGYVNIFGFADQLEFDINMRSAPGSLLGLPLGNTGEVVFEDFVRFVDPDNPDVEQEPTDLSGIRLNFQLEITPDVDFEIVFDRAVGDVMTGRGQGFLNMDINQFGDFAMYGVVEVLQGDYLFTLKNLVNKPFKNATGTIAWYGDPYEADINLSTTYSVSASLYELMPGEDERYKQRVPVDLTLHLTDNLMRPNIGFDILLPTVDQLTRSRVESVLANVEEKNRQAFALLVLQRFISPPNVTKEKSGGIGLAENTSELVSSQLSNWLSQISNDFNLGFNYRPGDEISNDEIALALSTQLFDERLMLSTNVGVSRGSSSNQNPSTLIGDIRVEYKITSEGKIRLMVYNESNDFNIASTQQSLYTQGVGVIYQEEFDTMDEFFCQFGNLLRRRNNRNLCP